MNNILLASQNGCDLVLIKEEGGAFPAGSKVFYYDDTDGARKGFDVTEAWNCANFFENNQNIAVDWDIDEFGPYDATKMFAGSAIKSFKHAKKEGSTFSMVTNMFEGCADLRTVLLNMEIYSQSTSFLNITNSFIDCTSLTDAEIYVDNTPRGLNVSFHGGNLAFKNCTSLRNVKLTFADTYCLSAYFMAAGMFMNCTSLENISLNSVVSGYPRGYLSTDMFKGCRLGPAQLQQVLDFEILMLATTIGYDPELVDPNTDKPEGGDSTWAEAFAAKGWTVTWEAYTAPVENAPKLLAAKGSRKKLYKLDEVPEEALEFMGGMDMYTKGGKHYLVTSGDSVTAPGEDGALLRDTEVENVVWASNLEEALAELGAVKA